MLDKPQFTAAGRYVLTDIGREALYTDDCCRCYLKIEGFILECPLCGTVYANLREQQTTDRRSI